MDIEDIKQKIEEKTKKRNITPQKDWRWKLYNYELKKLEIDMKIAKLKEKNT